MRYIQADHICPHGAVATVHRFHSVELRETAVVTLNSYVDASQSLILWQDQFEMPLLDYAAATGMPAQILEWFVSPAGPLAGGVLVEPPASEETPEETPEPGDSE